MAQFKYQAKKGSDKIVEGVIMASNSVEAIRMIEELGYTPIEVSEESQSDQGFSKKNSEKIHSKSRSAHSESSSASTKKVSLYDICVFTRQLASMLRSNLPILTALEFIQKQTQSDSLSQILNFIVTDIRNGGSFSDALKKHGGRNFDGRFISMIRSGESGGSLDAIMDTLANHLEKEEETRSQLRSALAYPALIVVVGFVTLFFLFTFCLPRLSGLFQQSYESLPWITKVLMAFGRTEWQVFLWMSFLGTAVASIALFVGKGGKQVRRQRLMMKLPLLGQIKIKSDISRFCDTMAMLIDNGIPVYEAIAVTRPVLSNPILENDLGDAQKRIMDGEMMTAVFRDSSHFPGFVTQMISVGEESGNLSNSLREVARFYSREASRSIKVLTSLLEPIFILGLSLIVGFMVAGLMLPIFDMNWMN